MDTALTGPQVRAEDWSLRLHGMVDREMRYSYDDIRNRPLIERTITMTCVSNEVGGDYVSTSNFIGIDVADLLDEAGVKPGSEQLFCTSVDGWTSGTPVATVRDRDLGAMLAIGMNGEPLPLEHGFPARLHPDRPARGNRARRRDRLARRHFHRRLRKLRRTTNPKPRQYRIPYKKNNNRLVHKGQAAAFHWSEIT